MTRAVLKYEVPVDDQWHEITVHTPARVWHVACQSGHSTVQVWAEVTTDSAETTTRRIRVFGTGHPIPDGAVYVGTALTGPFVWHVYAEATP